MTIEEFGKLLGVEDPHEYEEQYDIATSLLEHYDVREEDFWDDYKKIKDSLLFEPLARDVLGYISFKEYDRSLHLNMARKLLKTASRSQDTRYVDLLEDLAIELIGLSDYLRIKLHNRYAIRHKDYEQIKLLQKASDVLNGVDKSYSNKVIYGDCSFLQDSGDIF